MRTEKMNGISDRDLLVGQKAVIIEGALTTIFMAITGSMVGSVFLTSFFLKIGATSLEIGILASLPQLAYIGQFLGSYYIEKYGNRKKFCISTSAIQKLLWFAVAGLPLLLPQVRTQAKVWLMFGAIFISSLFGALSGAAWASWMADFIHPRMRGNFFSRRNIFIGLATFLAPVAVGKYLDLHGDFRNYALVFCVSTLIGLAGTWFLRQVPMLKIEKEPDLSFVDIFRAPLRDNNFRNFLCFTIFWALSTIIMAPYVPVFLLKEISLSQYTISIYIALFTLSHIISTLVWGNLSDRFGHRPVLAICVLAVSFIPLGYAIMTPHNYRAVMPLLYLIGGIFWAGIGLSLFNLLMALLPEKGKSKFISSFFSFVGIFGVIAPLLGALIMDAFREFSASLLGLPITNYIILFIFAAILRFTAFVVLTRVKVSGEISAPALIRQFRLINPFTAFANLSMAVRTFSKSAGNKLKRTPKPHQHR